MKAEPTCQEEKGNIIEETTGKEGDCGDKHDDWDYHDQTSGEDSGELECPGNE